MIGQEFTVRVSHPNLLCALLIHGLPVAVFLSLQSLSLFFWIQTAKCKKRKDHCEVSTDCSFAKVSHRKYDYFFAFAKLPNHWLFAILLPKLNFNYHYGRENQNNSACQSNHALSEKFAEDIDFMLSVHF